MASKEPATPKAAVPVSEIAIPKVAAVTPKVTGENFGKLKPGMTQEQLEGILGKGELASAEDLTGLRPDYKSDYDSKQRLSVAAWNEAVRVGKVYVWKSEKHDGGYSGLSHILAGYFGDPRAGSKVMAVNFFNPEHLGFSEKGSMRRGTTENFARLSVGMTLAQVQETLGEGRRTASTDAKNLKLDKNTAWASEIARSRVQFWPEGDPFILAAFSGDPSASGTAKVFLRYSAFQSGDNYSYIQKPAGMWEVSEENFDKLKPGMTLKEVEEILAAGQQIIYKGKYETSISGGNESGLNAWRNASQEGRVWFCGKKLAENRQS